MRVTAEPTVLELDDRPVKRGAWFGDLWAHRDVFVIMSKAGFQSTYKRSSLGIIWAVAVPLLQALVITVVFAKLIQIGSGREFGLFVLSGIGPWSYFSGVLGQGATAIVDGTGMTDKVWFPRALLPGVPLMVNLPPFLITLGVLAVSQPILGGSFGLRMLWFIPAGALLIAFSGALVLALSALHVYFRDVRFLVQAALIVWFYVTPIAYPASRAGTLRPFFDFNPVTGIVGLFRNAVMSGGGENMRALTVSLAATFVLLVVGLEAQRRYDRLFVDLL